MSNVIFEEVCGQVVADSPGREPGSGPDETEASQEDETLERIQQALRHECWRRQRLQAD